MPRTFFNKTKLPFDETEAVPKFKVKLFGDWEETIKTLNRLGPEIKESSVKAQLKVGHEILHRVRQHMLNQDLNWKALSSKYAKAKGKYGGDDRILILWGNYYHAIEVWQVSNHHTVCIGVRAGQYTQGLRGGKSKLQIAQIALIHEFSRGKIPRRPLWNPTIAEMGGVNGIKNLFAKHLYATLRRNGIPFKNITIF